MKGFSFTNLSQSLDVWLVKKSTTEAGYI
ncbi:hypothetical protein EMIT0P228_40028 [Pseudomonas brassicacearum]